MKAILEFDMNDPNDKVQYLRALEAQEYYIVLRALLLKIRHEANGLDENGNVSASALMKDLLRFADSPVAEQILNES
jgi:hypothetical protein